ncbi:Protein of unknown function [Lactobacillus helveticus CIRM-BIA 953]|uniref:Uncharacterized protein n=1 Tax=Lactobacillus helveticus CIRM-BIA 953 TaxID=1226335 RepID=U4QD11_LACHE|nr:Protein of unknown function [Lactobacillus helveticus CIRM-BIA 953]
MPDKESRNEYMNILLDSQIEKDPLIVKLN